MKATRPTKRELWLIRARVAGYHNDGAALARLFVEARVNRETLREAERAGARMRAGGVRCDCSECSAR